MDESGIDMGFDLAALTNAEDFDLEYNNDFEQALSLLSTSQDFMYYELKSRAPDTGRYVNGRARWHQLDEHLHATLSGHVTCWTQGRPLSTIDTVIEDRIIERNFISVSHQWSEGARVDLHLKINFWLIKSRCVIDEDYSVNTMNSRMLVSLWTRKNVQGDTLYYNYVGFLYCFFGTGEIWRLNFFFFFTFKLLCMSSVLDTRVSPVHESSVNIRKLTFHWYKACYSFAYFHYASTHAPGEETLSDQIFHL